MSEDDRLHRSMHLLELATAAMLKAQAALNRRDMIGYRVAQIEHGMIGACHREIVRKETR